MNPDLKQLQDDVAKLQRDIEGLTQAYYSNNFSSHQDFNKSSAFNYRLRIPAGSSLPSTNNVGEIFALSGVLYISTGVDTWTKVGAQ